MEIEEAKNKVSEIELVGIEVHRIDDYLFRITKTRNQEVYTFTEDEESQLRERFNFVAPWHKEYGLSFFMSRWLFKEL